MLKLIRKGITRDQVRHAVSLCREAGIIAHTSFIVGLPGETADTLRGTGSSPPGSARCTAIISSPLSGYDGPRGGEKVRSGNLTDDWTRYDANSAIVRTSALSPEEMNRFVADFESEIANVWEEMVPGIP